MHQNETILQECLQALAAGEPLEQILQRHPQEAGLLRPELEAAHWLAAGRRSVEPRPGFVGASRGRLMARLKPATSVQRFSLRAGLFLRSRAAMAISLLLLVAVLTFNSTTLVRAAPTWLPGDALYPIKTATEGMRLATASSPAEQARWHIEYAEKRLLEAQALVIEGHYAEIQPTVDDFDQHVDRAVALITRVAEEDPEAAMPLAESLQMVLSGQNRMVALLADISPGEAQAGLQEALLVARQGLAAVRSIVADGGG